ncbi:MAG: DUF4097 family beta strand repeat-containing protein [Acholeplasmataceae bacterium]
MKKTIRILLIVATLLVLSGVALVVGVLAKNDFDVNTLDTNFYEDKQKEIAEDFNMISIDVEISDIEFVKSDNETTKISYVETKNMTYDIKVLDNTLMIESHNTSKWYNFFNFNYKRQVIIVNLPKITYDSFIIKTNTGNINVSGNVNDINIKSDTGNVNLEGVNANDIDILTATGRTTFKNVNVTNKIIIKADTGRIELSKVNSNSLRVKTDTGRVKLEEVVVATTIYINTSTGPVIFKGSDANELYISTSTGSVSGSILTNKIFRATSDTGRVNVPKTTTGGICEIETNTGNINITIGND